MLFLEKNSKTPTQIWAIPGKASRIAQVFMESCLSYYIVGPALMAFQTRSKPALSICDKVLHLSYYDMAQHRTVLQCRK